MHTEQVKTSNNQTLFIIEQGKQNSRVDVSYKPTCSAEYLNANGLRVGLHWAAVVWMKYSNLKAPASQVIVCAGVLLNQVFLQENDILYDMVPLTIANNGQTKKCADQFLWESKHLWQTEGWRNFQAQLIRHDEQTGVDEIYPAEQVPFHIQTDIKKSLNTLKLELFCEINRSILACILDLTTSFRVYSLKTGYVIYVRYKLTFTDVSHTYKFITY